MPNPLETLLGNTRGQIVARLRSGPATVNDLAEAFHLTDNAVRAHLDALLADEIIAQVGFQPGTRKPHALFDLTPAAREHFSSLYVPVLNALLAALADHFPPDKLESIIREIGSRLASNYADDVRNLSFQKRADFVLKLLKNFGALVQVEKKGVTLSIRGNGCPLAESVATNPNVCALLETFLATLLDRPVHEHCTKSPRPQCCFTVN